MQNLMFPTPEPQNQNLPFNTVPGDLVCVTQGLRIGLELDSRPGILTLERGRWGFYSSRGVGQWLETVLVATPGDGEDRGILLAPNGWSLGVAQHPYTTQGSPSPPREKDPAQKVNSAEAVKPYSGPTDSRV